MLLFLLNCALQTTADQQQWVYQNYKRNLDPRGNQLTASSRAQIERQHGLGPADAARGFNTHGLFAWSRHPNFAHEQGNWYVPTRSTLTAAKGLCYSHLQPVCPRPRSRAPSRFALAVVLRCAGEI